MDWKPTTSIHQIRSFLNLAGYYRCCIPNFSRISKPMTEIEERSEVCVEQEIWKSFPHSS
jgi:hypothetical protein